MCINVDKQTTVCVIPSFCIYVNKVLKEIRSWAHDHTSVMSFHFNSYWWKKLKVECHQYEFTKCEIISSTFVWGILSEGAKLKNCRIWLLYTIFFLLRGTNGAKLSNQGSQCLIPPLVPILKILVKQSCKIFPFSQFSLVLTYAEDIFCVSRLKNCAKCKSGWCKSM